MLGDSVPAGHGTDAAPWPRRLPDRVDALSPGDVTVDAAPGRSMVDCAGRVSDAVDSLCERPADDDRDEGSDGDADPLAVVVQVGHNDAQLRGDRPRVTEEAFAGAARAVDARLRRDPRVADVAFLGLVPLVPGVDVPLDEETQPLRSLAYDRLLAGSVGTHRQAAAAGSEAPAPDDWRCRTVDGVHPDSAGHRRLAARVTPWLRSCA